MNQPVITLISRRTALWVFALAALTPMLMGAAEWSMGVLAAFDKVGYPLVATGALILFEVVRRRAVDVITGQRAGVILIGTYFFLRCAWVWLDSSLAGDDPYVYASIAPWLICTHILFFVCFPARLAAMWSVVFAAGIASLPWLLPSAALAPRVQAFTPLVVNAVIVELVFSTLLYGISSQLTRLATAGARTTTTFERTPVVSVAELVSRREVELRRLLQSAEEAGAMALAREAELRAMLDTFPGLVIRMDSDGTISYANSSAAALFGLPPEKVIGRHARTLFDPQDLQLVAARNMVVAKSGLPASFEHSVIQADGLPRDLLTTHFCIASAQGVGQKRFYVIALDIAERKRAEQALREAKAEAERANQAKSRFMSGMSHELRTPLNAVLGLTQVLRSQGSKLDASQREYLRTIEHAGRYLLALIDDTMDLSRIEAGELRVDCEPLALESLLHAVVSNVEPLAASHGVTISMVPPFEAAWVHADPLRLRQVVLNLVTNAIKYNRPGGNVVLRVSRDAEDWLLAVQDTGLGLTAEQQAQLFQPFNRLGAERSAIQGTGIGLVIARRLVGLMRGQVEVLSEVGVGSVFSVRLPAIEAPAEASEDSPPTDFSAFDACHDVSGSVLYVEDNEINVMVFEACLSCRPSVKLRVARSAAQAMAMIRHEPADLVVLDLNLPDMSGLELADELAARANGAQPAMVLLTADATAEVAQKAMRHSIDAVWHKPVDSKQLLANIDAYLTAARQPRLSVLPA